ncbi:hypothetical protein BDF20DRAFT_839259 [Mycotypha africana]|uniref:uncharacterized protein n=1 Tax=Mycotypha africana TaxID=64632 RepID=UPI00230092C6|nr:uncharacterized protein BDF20DRAFT_839259 [Mycotypha africana]KAI8969326.1 hypothetical protein BDF20DRAFT_839259 [Mycotypha africana]
MANRKSSAKPPISKQKTGSLSRIEKQKIRPDTILNRSVLIDRKRKIDARALIDIDERYPFVSLLQAINLRAENLARQDVNFPLMDISALYCIGIAVKEYVSFLSKKDSISSYGDYDRKEGEEHQKGARYVDESNDVDNEFDTQPSYPVNSTFDMNSDDNSADDSNHSAISSADD